MALCNARDGDTLFEQGTNRESPAVVSREAVSPSVDGRSLVRGCGGYPAPLLTRRRSLLARPDPDRERIDERRQTGHRACVG